MNPSERGAFPDFVRDRVDDLEARQKRRREAFYRFNGQLSSVRKSLGSSIGVLKSLRQTGDLDVKALSEVYDNLRRIQNRIFDDECR